MDYDRRDFINLTLGGTAFVLGQSMSNVWADEPTSASKIKAIAFDAFCIFDPRPVFSLAEQLFPGSGKELSNEWRTRQFEYTWLRVIMGHYADFWVVTRESLEYAAEKLNITLTADQCAHLMNAYLELKPWPDVVPALHTLRKSGMRLALLSNFTPTMLKANLKSAGLLDLFDLALSTDSAKTYKPDPHAYQLGIDSFKLKREEILFVAFGGWDAAGARSFGYKTFWTDRLGLPAEKLGSGPIASGRNLDDLLSWIKAI